MSRLGYLPHMNAAGTLAEVFVAALPEAWRDAGPAEQWPERLLESRRLEGLLNRVVDRAKEAWPDFPYPLELFLEDLASRTPEDVDLFEHLESLPAADLFLAYACGRGLDGAVEAFERRVIPVVSRALTRLGAQPDAVDEVQQRLRERFLVGVAGKPPAVSTYAGFGSLAAWVRVSALREYYGMAREGQRFRQVEDADLGEEMDGIVQGPGSELGYLKKRYRPHFRAALAEAMTLLEARQRNVLRQHYLDGLQVDQLGMLYRVHRVTASRWLAGARKAVLSHTRRLLMARLDLAPEELDSMIRLVSSRLDISIRAHLGTGEEPG